MIKRNKIILMLVGFVMLFLYISFGKKYVDKRHEKNYNKFNSTNVKGTISKIEIYSKGVRIRVNGDFFIFHPLSSKLNQNRTFISNAKLGDSIIKPPYNDTLIIKNYYEKIKYTFW